MRKTDKKIDNQLRKVLTDLCDNVLKELTGFEWITHVVNFTNFPKSLKIICVFDTNAHLNAFKATNECRLITDLIQQKMFELKINIDDSRISYDSEENGSKSHHGNWANRL